MSTLISWLSSPEAHTRLASLYPQSGSTVQADRYAALIRRYETLYGCAPQLLVSSPGRTEICGNHTDHNHGQVLCAAVDIDILAAVGPRQDGRVRLQSDGFAPVECILDQDNPVPEEAGTPASIIRGMAAGLRRAGLRAAGFDAAVTSDVRAGSGLSSSAAFEVLIAAIEDALYNDGTLDPVVRAQMAQVTENRYFGKPSGLMDQMACSVGGFIHIDFEAEPKVERLPFDLAAHHLDLVIVNTGSSHDNLTDAYAAIPREMKAVAAFFGAETLREVPEAAFMDNLARLREAAGDRAVLRSLHFYEENHRVEQLSAALKHGDIRAFRELLIASGRSSFAYLQNVYAQPDHQPLSLALALAERMLDGCGAWRIHGGGFAGTTLNIVPQPMTPSFISQMEALFGARCCQVLSVRPFGPAVVARAD